MRSTRVSSCARLVITAETCGICDIPAKVAPPLKSTSTMLSCSGEWVIARPSTRVRRNSDFPEPVAPMTRPCGPMPCWADSLMSRWTRPPPSPSPIGTRSRSRAGRGRHAAAGSKWCTSPRPRRSMKSSGPVISADAASSAPAGDGVQRGEPAREGLGRGEVALVAEREHRVLADPQRLDRHLVGPRRGARRRGRVDVGVVELEAQAGRVVELVPAARQVEQGHAVQAVGRDDVVAGRQVAAVDDEQDVRAWRGARRRRSAGGRSGRVAAAPAGRRGTW